MKALLQASCKSCTASSIDTYYYTIRSLAKLVGKDDVTSGLTRPYSNASSISLKPPAARTWRWRHSKHYARTRKREPSKKN